MSKTCTIGDCARPAVARIQIGPHRASACATHYQRHRRGRPLEPPLRPTGLERVTVRLRPHVIAALRRIYPGIDLAAAVREAVDRGLERRAT